MPDAASPSSTGAWSRRTRELSTSGDAVTDVRARSAASVLAAVLSFVTLACIRTSRPADRAGVRAHDRIILPGTLRAHVEALADDSMQGRRTGTEGARRAARYIAAELQAIGLVPLGDSGYLQRVPLGLRARIYGPAVPFSLPDWRAYDTLPPSSRVTDANVIGLLRGRSGAEHKGAIIVAAHYDHHGIKRADGLDSILNGADDNASGVATVLAIASAMAGGPVPQRPVIFLFPTGEELGLLGTAWYIAHPPLPIDRTVAFLGIEMTGRSDSLAGGVGHAWLTGDERSTIGSTLRSAGLSIMPDPRPSQRFFERSDNFAFARAGVPAHTLSSFGVHRDYHRVSDESAGLDIGHMTAVARTAAAAVRLLAAATPPRWNPGGKP